MPMTPEHAIAVAAADANRAFSRLLREVREDGQSFTVTSHGKPVARILPVTAEPARAAARATLLARLATQPVAQAAPWTRDDLYTR